MKNSGQSNINKGVWVFGDYRDYFQNRVTLQLIAKGKDLAQKLDADITVLVLGHKVIQYAMEYVAHGADVVIVVDNEILGEYRTEVYTPIVGQLVRQFYPDIFLAGGTSFGREFFPRLAKHLETGLSADCISLDIHSESKLLLQTTPSFGGELFAEIITPNHKPQMVTVHPGIFKEKKHDSKAIGRIIYPKINILDNDRIEHIESYLVKGTKSSLEDSEIVIVGGRGMGSREEFKRLYELAELLGGEVGATRPVIRAGWAEEERLIGQTGKVIKPKLLITVGTSGAIQYTTGIHGAETIIAINRDPHAPIFNISDLGLVGDAHSLLSNLLLELKERC